MNNLSKHVRSDKAKWIITGIVFVLILAILGGVVAAVVTETNPKEWFEKPVEEQPADEEQGGEGELPPVVDENGETMESGKVYPMPAQMIYTSSATTAEDGTTVSSNPVTLHATITPSNASDTSVTWSVSFVNPSSEWANGKTVTDYVSIVASGLSCEVTCHQAFGEQIKITVVSNDNAEATDSCVVDYLKRVEDVTFALSNGVTVKNISEIKPPRDGVGSSEDWATEVDWTFDGEGEIYTYDINFVEGVGTVSGNYTAEVFFNLNAVAFQNDEAPMFGPWFSGLLSRYENGESYMLNNDAPMSVTDGITFGVSTFEHFFGNEALLHMDALAFYFVNEPTFVYNGIKGVLACKAYGAFVFEIKLRSGLIDSGNYASLTYEFPVNINPDTFYIPVNDIGLNDGGTIIF